MRLIDADELLKIIDTWDWQELYLPVYFKEMAIDKALTVEPEPVYFPPCIDCQNRSKKILTAYDNMKKMQAYTKEEVITMLNKIRADVQNGTHHFLDGEPIIEIKEVLQIIDKYNAESEGKE